MNVVHKDLVVGPSTGWLSAKIGPSVENHNKILAEAEVSAYEMVLGDEQRIHAILDGGPEFDVKYRSLHLGSFADFNTTLTPEQQDFLKNIRRIAQQYNIHGTSLRPDTTPFHIYSSLLHHGIPVGIENMDRMKEAGKSVEEIEYLVASTGASGVIDLQHCYEISQDTGVCMNDLALRLAKVMLKHGGIAHIHLSGEVSDGRSQVLNHAQLTIATNRDAILQALKSVFDYTDRPLPIILEGDPLHEYEYLKPNEKVSEYEKRVRSGTASDAFKMEVKLVKDFLNS